MNHHFLRRGAYATVLLIGCTFWRWKHGILLYVRDGFKSVPGFPASVQWIGSMWWSQQEALMSILVLACSKVPPSRASCSVSHTKQLISFWKGNVSSVERKTLLTVAVSWKNWCVLPGIRQAPEKLAVSAHTFTLRATNHPTQHKCQRLIYILFLTCVLVLTLN